MRLFLFITFLFAASCTAKSADETFEKHVDWLFEPYTISDEPGFAIGVIRHGELILAKGYGLSDIANNEPITAQTSFNLASLSKQFTAAAIAMEIEDGRIAMDDTLDQHWPDLPKFMKNITIAHLVYMTSGLKEYYTLPSPKGGWESENRFTIDDAITAVLASESLAYEPGTRWTYSNINYQLLAVLVAKLEKMSFPDYMEETFFEPLQMTHSWIDAPIDETRNYRSTSYVRTDDDTGWQIAPRLSPHFGGSGVFASLNDLARWDAALYSDHAFGDDFTKRMLSTRHFNHDKDNDAYGLVHGSYRGLKTIWYEGGDYGVSTYMVRMPERNETIICLSNFNDGQCADKARAVIDLLLSPSSAH